MYYNGQGVSQDYIEALKWRSNAAEQGDALAQAALGAAYEEGRGVPQDYVQAHMWLNLAAAAGDKKAAKLRDIIAAKLSPTELAEAQRLAREWKPNVTTKTSTGE